MKYRKPIPTPTIIDQSYISSVYENLQEKMSVLDKLTHQYKQKQEEHFLHTFMNVIDKIGGELLLAQEAYKNVDLEAKKDTYYLELAEELSFYKRESLNLKELLNQTHQQLKKVKNHNQQLETEVKQLQTLIQKKVKENLAIKQERRQRIKGLAQLGLDHNNTFQIDISGHVSPSLTRVSGLVSPTLTVQGEQGRISSLQKQAGGTALPGHRKRNSVALSPVGKDNKSTIQSFYSTSRSIRSKGHRRILPEWYDPQTGH